MTVSLGGARVLIVEDNFVVADSLRFVVEGFGGVVVAIVSNLAKAFETVAAAPIDVAVLDINLGGTSVAPLAEHLRAAAIPFVFLTGYGDIDLLPEPLRACPRFDKPVNADRLMRALYALTAGTP